MNLSLRCQCGAVQGVVDPAQVVARALCYCKNCQAYAEFLGPEHDILNGQGGTEIIVTLPASLQFTSGVDQLACVTLSPKGPLRWYASCCRTPIGNTPRAPTTAYLGLLRVCLAESDALLNERLRPLDVALNRKSARGGTVPSTPAATLFGGVRIMKMVLGARLSGRYEENPFFFRETGTPIREPARVEPPVAQA